MQKRLYDKEPLNKLVVVKKPMFMSSNSYLNRIKRKYKNKTELSKFIWELKGQNQIQY